MATVTTPTPLLGLFDLERRPLPWRIAAMAAGTAVLTCSSYIVVPAVPVPFTMQTFAVTLIGALFGWRLGAATVAAWLMEGALGLPVFAGGTSGLLPFMGPTGGFLLTFPAAAALTGWLVARGWDGRRPALAFAAMLAGNVACLAGGAAWLSVSLGAATAVAVGVAPFLVGAALKSALGAAVLRAALRRA
jgi:biotin transport system substrate-specific component